MSAGFLSALGRACGRGLAATLLATLALGGGTAIARESAGRSASAEVALADLPREARETLALIKRGGPYPYRKDGTVFQNREKRLPIQKRGYYTEYTVRTPWERDRGPRRIVAGAGNSGDPATSGEYWYTADHYNTFARIRE